VNNTNMNRQQIINELQTVFDGDPWYGNSIMKTLNNVDKKNINNTYKSSGNLAQILEHILAWRNYTLEMLKGNFSYKIEIDSVEDWNKDKTYTVEDWQELVSRLKQNQTAIIELVENTTEEDLEKQLPGKKYNLKQLLQSSMQHDLYHLGQIALLNG